MDPSLCNCHADVSTECDRLLTASSIKTSLPYLGLFWLPSFLFSLVPALQSHSRCNLSLALSRLIGVKSSVAIHRTEHFSACANLKCRCTFVSVRSIQIFSIWPQANRHTYACVLQCSHASVGLAQARPNYETTCQKYAKKLGPLMTTIDRLHHNSHILQNLKSNKLLVYLSLI